MALIFADSFDHYTTLLQKYNTGNGTITTTAGVARTGVGCLSLGNSAEARRVVLASQEHATLILGCAMRLNSSVQIVYFVGDGGLTTHGHVQFQSTGVVQAMRFNQVLLGQSSASQFSANTWFYAEIMYTLHDTAGAIQVRINGTTVLNLSAVDTKNAGTKATLDGFQFTNSGGGGFNYIDDVYLCNPAGTANTTYLGDVRVAALLPNGAGATTQLTPTAGANYTNVDDQAPTTTDLVQSTATGQYDTYNLADYAPTNATVYGATLHAFAQKSDVGLTSLAPMVRVGATDYEGASQALSFGGYRYYSQLYETNPATGAPWTVAEINTAEFGVRSR